MTRKQTLLVITMLLLLLASAYAVLRYQPQKKTTTITKNTTDGQWHTYTNATYGYHLDYPSETTIAEKPPKDLPADMLQGVTLQFTQDDTHRLPLTIAVWKNLGVTIKDTATRDIWCETLMSKQKDVNCDHKDAMLPVAFGTERAYKITRPTKPYATIVSYIPTGDVVYQVTYLSSPQGTGIFRDVESSFSSLRIASIPTAKMCPQDQKQCPNGSIIFRQGATCEFASCPIEKVTKKN